MPLATIMMSGAMPAHSWAKSLPVRPMPHCTSSKYEQRPAVSSQSIAQARQALIGHRKDAALALHRFQDHRRHVWSSVDCLRQCAS